MKEPSPAATKILEQIEVSDKPLAIMGIGIPESGRSTLLEEVAWHSGPKHQTINVDALRTRFIRLRAGKKLDEFVDQEMYKQIENNMITHGLSLIDETNIEAKRRTLDIGRYRDMGAMCVGSVFMDTDYPVALLRTIQRAEPVTSLHVVRMSAALEEQRPTIEEGFDWMVSVKPGEITVNARV